LAQNTRKKHTSKLERFGPIAQTICFSPSQIQRALSSGQPTICFYQNHPLQCFSGFSTTSSFLVLLSSLPTLFTRLLWLLRLLQKAQGFNINSDISIIYSQQALFYFRFLSLAAKIPETCRRGAFCVRLYRRSTLHVGVSDNCIELS
jgi:hypothetical protein